MKVGALFGLAGAFVIGVGWLFGSAWLCPAIFGAVVLASACAGISADRDELP